MHWLALVLLLNTWVQAAAPSLQAPGFAEITRPAAGEAVRGIVTLEGTANHPAFDHFDLAFAYDQDPTDTWFPIVDADRSRVVEGRLAVWDTSGVGDGVYRLRLRVWPNEGEPLIATVGGVRVRNLTSIETPTAGPTAQAQPETPAPQAPTPSPTAAAPMGSAQAPGGRVQAALLAGGILGLVVLAGVGGYAGARAAARSAWGSARATRRAERRRRPRTLR